MIWLSLLLKLDCCMLYVVCLFVCPVCNKVLGESKLLINVVYIFICGVYQECKNF